MNKPKEQEVKNSSFIEILDNKSADKISLKGYNKILIPYNNSYSFCIFVSERERKNVLPFFIEDILYNIPIPIIIFDTKFKTISTNIIEKAFHEKAREEVKSLGEKNLEKLYLLESITGKFSYKKEEFKFLLNPLIKDKSNPGYICTIENSRKTVELNFPLINHLADEILSAKRLEKLSELTEKIKAILKTETLSFFLENGHTLEPVFIQKEKQKEKITIPANLKKQLAEKELIIIHKELFPIKLSEYMLGRYLFIYKLKLSKKESFIVLGSSNKRIEKNNLIKLRWILKIFLYAVKQAKTKREPSNIFDDYKLPAILVNKKTLKIVYANKSFKKYFGKEIFFFNAIFPLEANIKVLKKLDSEFEPFSDYIEVITGDNFKTIVKLTVIPDIIFENQDLFAAIFKTQKDEIKIKVNLQENNHKSTLSIEAIPMLVEKYTSILSKTKNIEKSINYFLKDISNHLNAGISFIGKIDKKNKKITILNTYKSKKGLTPEVFADSLSGKKEVFEEKESKIVKLDSINGLSLLLILKLRPRKNSNYIWGIGFCEHKNISAEERIAIQTFANLISIAFRKKEKESIFTEVEKEKDQLKKINKEIISTLSHEIKTPLTSILGLCEVISNKLKEEDKELVSSVKKNALKLLDLLETILELNKMKEKGTGVIKKRSINTNEFLESIKSFVIGINKNPNVEFKIKTKNEKPFFVHDVNIIYRIIINLLDNAFRYTKRGVVTLSLNFENEHLILEVKDTGEGISQKNLKNVFVPFFQEKNPTNNNNKNVGLGLYIVKQLCDIIGGEIFVSSEKKIGTYFKIKIPMREKNELNTHN